MCTFPDTITESISINTYHAVLILSYADCWNQKFYRVGQFVFYDFIFLF